MKPAAIVRYLDADEPVSIPSSTPPRQSELYLSKVGTFVDVDGYRVVYWNGTGYSDYTPGMFGAWRIVRAVKRWAERNKVTL